MLRWRPLFSTSCGARGARELVEEGLWKWSVVVGNCLARTDANPKLVSSTLKMHLQRDHN